MWRVIQIGLRHFDSRTLDWFAGLLREGGHSRHSLSSGLCERTGWVEGLDRARELAAACPDTRVVSVCDREGDFRELLAHAAEHGDALLVRASRSARQRVLTEGGEGRGACGSIPPPCRSSP